MNAMNRRDFIAAGAGLAAAAFATNSVQAQPQGGRVTAHVLDVYSGTPAQGIRIELTALENGTARLLKSVVTNADGRPPEGPLVNPDGMKTGRYQVIVHVGDYYKRIGAKLP